MNAKTKETLSAVAIITAAALWCWMGFSFLFRHQDGVYYNCQFAETSPDFPQEVKEKCRNGRV